MHTVNLIASAIRKDSILPQNIESGICCVTGQEGDCILRSEIFGKSFTNLDLLKAPDSNFIGIDAYLVLSYKWERYSLWWCDGKEFKRPNRTEVREMVLDGVDAKNWAGYVTTSYKKHGALVAKVNYGNRGIWRFEMKDVNCRDGEKVNEWYSILVKALYDNIGRTVLETLDCSAWLIGKIGLEKWIIFEQWARPKYQSALYQFLCYLLPSKEERNKNGSKDN